MEPKNQDAEDDGTRSDRILAAVYADEQFMLGVRRAITEIEDGKKGTHFRDLKRKAHT